MPYQFLFSSIFFFFILTQFNCLSHFQEVVTSLHTHWVYKKHPKDYTNLFIVYHPNREDMSECTTFRGFLFVKFDQNIIKNKYCSIYNKKCKSTQNFYMIQFQEP